MLAIARIVSVVLAHSLSRHIETRLYDISASLYNGVMRAIVIHQPWAWAIIRGIKRYENRTWSTRYRGPLVVIAGKSLRSMPEGRRVLSGMGIEPPGNLPLGAILGIVTLENVVTHDDDPLATGPYCWKLSEPVRLERPVPYNRGRQGLFPLESDVLQHLHLP